MELVLPKNYVEVTEEEMMYLDGGGFVGLYVNLSATTRKMAGWAAGLYAAGVANYYLSPLKALGPHGWGAAAVISGIAGTVVANAANSGLKTVPIGTYVNGFSWSMSVTI